MAETALTYRSPKTEVRSSPIHGLGLFAREAIAEREIVAVKGGHVLTARQWAALTPALGPAEMERYNENYVGGDINGGAATLSQLFTRPVARVSPYTTPLPGVFLCSSSTPPGGGVHGMCGYHAARAALRQRSGDSHAS